jgi:hypothetical protein
MGCVCLSSCQQLEIVSEDGETVAGPGMHVIHLPYADDLRKLKFDKPLASMITGSG